MKKTASLNMETDSNKLWRLTKQLNDEENRHAKITLLQDRKMVHGKQAANIFADTYKEASNIQVELHKQKYVRAEQRKITESDDVSTVMNSPLSYEELTSALLNLKLKKSPGLDAITNEMIVNLGQPALHKLLDIFNKTWQEGTLPQIWREATMIPIHKKGKAKTEASSYRPISLTSCIVKVLESKRRDMKNIIQAERYKYSLSHPMRKRMDAMTKHRIKRKSFIHKNNNLKRTYNNNSIKTVQCTYSSPPMSSEHTNRSLTIRTTIPTVTRDQEDTSKKLITLSHIDDFYPQATYTCIH